MAQPIRRKIQEERPELVKEEPIYTLLIDGNALLFHAMADDKRNSDGVHYGGVFQFLLQVRMMMQKKDFDYVYCFFDDEYSGWLRWKEYHGYKANRDKKYEDYGESEYMKLYNANLRRMQKAIFNKKTGKPLVKKEKSDWDIFIDENFVRERDILLKYFEELYIRWNIDDVTEGDDQIAYYCQHKKENEKIVIITSDMDLSQLLAEDVIIYNMTDKDFVTTKNFTQKYGYFYKNVLIKKIFCGDVSDNISNITGLSEEGFFKLMPEAKKREVTVSEVKERAADLIKERQSEKKKPLRLHENIVNGVGNKKYDGDFYVINEKLIDLSHPLMSEKAKETMDSIMYAPIDPTGRSFTNLYKYILEDKIEELDSDARFTSFFTLFKRLEEKEKKRYDESLK